MDFLSLFRCRRFGLFMGLATLAAMLFGPATTVLGQPAPFTVGTGFVAETAVAGLRFPTAFAFGPGGRLYITQQDGVVRVAQNGMLQAENFIDLSGEVNAAGQRGLLGIAIHPRFPVAPYLYLSYTYEPPEAAGHDKNGARVSRLLRVTARTDNYNLAAPGSGVVLLGTNSTFANIGNPDRPEKEPFSCGDTVRGFVQDCLPADGQVHSISHLAFGRDGALYVANGDGLNYGVGSLRAQEIDSLAGKILRINPMTGAGYPTNPFYNGDPQSNRAKVYALGMKNPYRFAIHPLTGELFIGDVGNFKWEELTRARAGANLGWPCYEGNNPNAFDPVCQPLLNGATTVTQGFHVYSHENGWGAVIGGDFYTGRAFPLYFRNAYFYGDFNKGTVQSVVFDRNGVPTLADFATGIPGIVQISNGPDGALYVLSVVTGALYRIRYVGDSTPFTPPVGASTGAQTDAASPATASTTPISASSATPAAVATTEASPTAAEGTNAAPASVTQPSGAGTGNILREWWTGIGGKSVADLTQSKKFGAKPDGHELLTALDAPRLFGNDYGARIRGYLYPPVTGDYRFWLASDDNSELWLSSDANPANKVRIAEVPEWTHAQQWDRFPSQQSALIHLQAGQRYYLEVLHKQADQKDNLSVAWQIPGGERQVIEGQYLSPAVP